MQWNIRDISEWSERSIPPGIAQQGLTAINSEYIVHLKCYAYTCMIFMYIW